MDGLIDVLSGGREAWIDGLSKGGREGGVCVRGPGSMSGGCTGWRSWAVWEGPTLSLAMRNMAVFCDAAPWMADSDCRWFFFQWGKARRG